MTRKEIVTSRRGLVLLAVTALLLLSLLLAGCGAHTGANNAGNSNISTGGTTQQTTAPGGSNGIQGADQQVQTAVSAVDGAQNDVNGADSAGNNDNGEQP